MTFDTKLGIKIDYVVRKTQCFVVGYGNVAGCLVANMDLLMPWSTQSLERAAHRDNVIVGVRAENQAAFMRR